jgi:hypothetical protein
VLSQYRKIGQFLPDQLHAALAAVDQALGGERFDGKAAPLALAPDPAGQRARLLAGKLGQYAVLLDRLNQGAETPVDFLLDKDETGGIRHFRKQRGQGRLAVARTIGRSRFRVVRTAVIVVGAAAARRRGEPAALAHDDELAARQERRCHDFCLDLGRAQPTVVAVKHNAIQHPAALADQRLGQGLEQSFD